jgi:choline-sulfatase
MRHLLVLVLGIAQATALARAPGDEPPSWAPPLQVVYDLLKLVPWGESSEGYRLGEGQDSLGPILGGFNTGFEVGEDGSLWASGSEAELVVTLDSGRDHRLEAEVSALRPGRLSLFANGRALGRRALASGRQTVAFEIPADALREGDTFLTFHLKGGARVRGRLFRKRRLLKRPVPEPRRLTFHRVEIRPVRRADERVAAVHVQIPQGGRLVARVAGEGRVAVRLEVEGERVREILAREVAGEADLNAAMEAWAGKVARLSLVSSGSAAWKEARLLAPSAPRSAPVQGPRRNVILWVVDALRADKLRCDNPKSRVRTPNFDSFARRGVLFRKAISQSSHSKPATASILTGHYPASHGASRHEDRLRTDIPLLSEIFQRAGFVTGAFAGNGFVGKPHGFVRGWHTFRNLLREGKPAKTPYLFRHIETWLRSQKDHPFFLYVHTVDPHVPYNPPKHVLSLYWQGPYRGRIVPRRSGHQLDDARAGKFHVGAVDCKYVEALYDGEVTVADFYFGKLLDLLEKLGLAGSTLIAVTADHGEEMWDHGNPGHGHTLYNELTRVPLLLGPAPITPAGRVVEADVEMVDLAPTLLELGGVPSPGDMQGQSLVPWLKADPPVGAPAFSVHEGRIASAQVGRWKYIVYRGGAQRVFDLHVDPGEQRDLSKAQPVVRRYLRGLLAQWLARQGTWRKSRDGILGQPR